VNEKTIGNKWYKFDFHTHTPASSDYANKADTEIDWLKSLMLKEVDCVAVTDHVSGAWVDRLKTAYDLISRTEVWFRELHIFPGVEITISTGINRVHVLAIFDPDTDTAKINALLGRCGILEGHGDAESTVATESVENVLNIVEGANGVVVAAHIDGPKGLLHNLKNTNLEIKRTLSNLIAAEFLDLNYLKREDVNVELKSDAKHLAIVSGSDAHSIDSLGSRFTWVKMGSPH